MGCWLLSSQSPLSIHLPEQAYLGRQEVELHTKEGCMLVRVLRKRFPALAGLSLQISPDPRPSALPHLSGGSPVTRALTARGGGPSWLSGPRNLLRRELPSPSLVLLRIFLFCFVSALDPWSKEIQSHGADGKSPREEVGGAHYRSLCCPPLALTPSHSCADSSALPTQARA